VHTAVAALIPFWWSNLCPRKTLLERIPEEIPRAQRFAARPELAHLFAGTTTRVERTARAVTAVRDHGYTMKEAADFIGRHYVTVSRALARADGLYDRAVLERAAAIEGFTKVSELEFRHHGLTNELDCIEMCTQGWDHYLASLRDYVETGRGNPRGSDEDLARRGEQKS